MAPIIADFYVASMVLLFYVALRFIPFTAAMVRLGNWERAMLGASMIVGKSAAGGLALWFYLPRAMQGFVPPPHSIHWVVLALYGGMTLACIGWIVALDWRRCGGLCVGGPILAATMAAWWLP